MRIPCFCIKELVIDFKYLDQDTFILEDNSLHEGRNRDEINSDFFTAKVTTPHKEEFQVDIPANGRIAVRRSDKGLMKMVDGIYCIEVDSCSDHLSTKTLYSPVLNLRIKNLLIKYGMTKDYLYINNQYSVMKVLSEYGMSIEAEKIFENIKRLLSDCEVRKM